MCDVVPRFGVAVGTSIVVGNHLIVRRKAIVLSILWGGFVVGRTGLSLLLAATSQLYALLTWIRGEVLVISRH